MAGSRFYLAGASLLPQVEGQTVLTAAIMARGRRLIVPLLLQHGASVNRPNAMGDTGAQDGAAAGRHSR